MTFKYNDVYLNNYALVVGPMEAKGPLKDFFDKSYKDFYMGKKTFEQAEIKMLEDCFDILLEKINKNNFNIDILVGGDLLNQIVVSNYMACKEEIPFIGIYSACANSMESIIVAANMISAKQVKNAICSVSSHNMGTEKQFRYPTEYGAPKPKRSTFTSTGGVCIYLDNEINDIKIESSTVGKVVNLGVTDVFNLGAAMAPAAASTLYRHLRDMKRTTDDYDLIVTGDLGRVGKKIFKEYLKEKYKVSIGNNYDDCGTLLYDLDKQEVFSGGSGPACSPLVTFGSLIPKMKTKKYQRILVIATGALFSPTMAYQKQSIPCIAHAVSFEVVK